MITDTQLALVALAAIAGGIFTALLGWMDSNENFATRKFMSSVLRAIVAGIVIAAVTFAYPEEVSLKTYFLAVLAGAGVDVLGNRASGALKSGVAPAVPHHSPSE